jgi:hypothetical protein
VLDRVRLRLADKRVLALIKAFLKAGVMSADGMVRDSSIGTTPGRQCDTKGARYEWIALVGGAVDAGNVISGQCLEACPHLGMRRW